MTSYLLSAGTVDITPERACMLAGFARRRAPFRDVRDPLEANAVVLHCQDHRRQLFVSVDLLYAGPLLLRKVEETAAQHGIPRESVFLTASHTHFAPASDPAKPALGEVDPGFVDLLLARVGGLVEKVLVRSPYPVTLTHHQSRAHHAVNRRRRWPWPSVSRAGFKLHTGTVMAPNPHGPCSEAIDLLRFENQDAVVAVVWSYACHPVSFPQALSVSAEYIGVVRSAIRRAVGVDIPVLFWQGFSGDIRPRVPAPPNTLRVRLATLRRGPGFGAFDRHEWLEWSASLSNKVTEMLQRQGRTIAPVTPRTALSRLPVARLLSGSASRGEVRFQHLQIGNGLNVLGVSAEPVAALEDRVRSEIGPETICVGCAGDVFGYLPTSAQVVEGGYEAGGFSPVFGLTGSFVADLDDLVGRALRAIAGRT